MHPYETPRARRLFAAAFATLLLAIAPTAAQSQEAADAHFFEASDGTPIRYAVTGLGDPIVLLHGIMSSAQQTWEMTGVIDRFAEEFQVIAVDQRGHGGSGKPHDPEMYGDRMAQDVVELLDHLRLPQANVVGYSMGGFVAMKVVTLAPERLLSAVIGGAGWANRELEGLQIFDQGFADEMIAWLETGEGSMPMAALLWPGDQQPAPEMVTQIGEAIRQANDPLALAAVMRAMEELVVSAELLRINRVPVLNIVGSDDPLKPAADALVGLMGEHRLHVIDGANHMTTLFHPEFADTIRAFFIELCNCA